MAYNSNKHGWSSYNSWIQIPDDATIEEGDIEDLHNSKFAKMCYLTEDLNETDISSIVSAKADQTNTFLTYYNEIEINESFSRIVQTVGTTTYIAEAPIGSSISDPVWRVQKISEDGSRQWVVNGNMTVIAERMQNMPFSYGPYSTESFKFTIDTNNIRTGGNSNTEFELPLVPNGGYDFIIDWGDGTTSHITHYNDSTVKHTYSSAGIYEIDINGICDGWSFGRGWITDIPQLDCTQSAALDSYKFISVENWGCIGFTGQGIFTFCINFIGSTATDLPDLSKLWSFSAFFYGCTAMSNINRINEWDVANPNIINKSFDQLFIGCAAFNQDIGDWDTSNVTGMAGIFGGAILFNNGGIGGIGVGIDKWNLSSIVGTSAAWNGGVWGMFTSAESFNQPIPTMLSTLNVKNCGGYLLNMFRSAYSFNQDISTIKWEDVKYIDNFMWLANSFNHPSISNINAESLISITRFMTTSYFKQSIANWNLKSIVTGVDIFGTGYKLSQFDTSLFDDTLRSWMYKELNLNASLSMKPMYSSIGKDARQYIINNFGWTLTTGINADIFTASYSSGKLRLNSNHDVPTYTRTKLISTGTLPSGLLPDTDYWLVKLTANTYNIATSLANAMSNTIVDYTTSGSGIHEKEIQGFVATASNSDGKLLLDFNYNFISGTKIRIVSDNTLPSGLSIDTDYWLINNSITNGFIATTYENAINGIKMDYVDAGVGNHEILIQQFNQ